MELINAIIIDDEPHAIGTLRALLSAHSEINIAGEAQTVEGAEKIISEKQADLLFLDIDLGNNETGFDLLERINLHEGVHVIFVTAYDKYAIKGFEYAALDYLLKPVDPERLARAISKLKHKKTPGDIENKIDSLLNFVKSDKIKFNTRTGFIYLHATEIIFCKADRDYTRIHLIDSREEMITTNLSNVLEKINHPGFIKISRSYIFNKEYLAAADRKKQTCLLKYDNREIEITLSRRVIREVERLLQ